MEHCRLEIKDKFNNVIYLRYVKGKKAIESAIRSTNKMCKGMQVLSDFMYDNKKVPMNNYRVKIKMFEK